MREMTVGALVVEAGVLTLMLLGYVDGIRDPYSDAGWFYLGVCSPALLGAYFVVETLWRRAGPGWRDGLIRMYTLGGFLHVANVLVLVSVGVPMQLSGTVAPLEGQAVGLDAVGQALGMGLIGFAALILAAIPALLLVVLPVSAFRSPEQIPRMLPVTDVREVGRNRVAVFALCALLISVFAVPTCIVFGRNYDNPTLVAVGIWWVPVMIVLAVVTILAQRAMGLRLTLRRGRSTDGEK